MSNLYCSIIAIFAVLISFVSALQCLQGTRETNEGQDIVNSLETRECADKEHICHRYEILTSKNNQTCKWVITIQLVFTFKVSKKQKQNS